MKKTINVTISRSGIPCLWESGGGYTNTGEAQIITDGQGYPKRAIAVRSHGDLACKEHALIPIEVGDHVVTVDRHRKKVAVQVYRIESIQSGTATVVPEREPICVDAINAAVEKSEDEPGGGHSYGGFGAAHCVPGQGNRLCQYQLRRRGGGRLYLL